MLRRLVAHSNQKLTTFQRLGCRSFSRFDNDDDDFDSEDEDEYNNLMYKERKDTLVRRPKMPEAAKRNRFMIVAPEKKAKLRRHLLDEFKKNQLPITESSIEGQNILPDAGVLESELEIEAESNGMTFNVESDLSKYDFERLGYLRQIVHVDQVQKVMPLENRINFRAMVVVGNRRGVAGYSMSKAPSVQDAIARATQTAIDNFTFVDRFDNRTLYHEVHGKWNSCTLFLRPSLEGRGNTVSDVVACVLDCFGIDDVVSKCHGSRNPYTVIKATFNALSKHESAEEYALKTGHSVAEISLLAKMRQL